MPTRPTLWDSLYFDSRPAAARQKLDLLRRIRASKILDEYERETGQYLAADQRRYMRDNFEQFVPQAQRDRLQAPLRHPDRTLQAGPSTEDLTQAASRPRVVANPVPETPPPPIQKRRTLADLSDDLRRLSNPNAPDFQPVEDNDKRNWKTQLGDILREFVVQAGAGYNRGIASGQKPTEALLGAAGAGAAGAAYESTIGDADETRRRLYEIAQLKAEKKELTDEQAAELVRIKNLMAIQKDTFGIAKAEQDLTLNRPTTVYDPLSKQYVNVTGNQAFTQGQQAVRQTEQLDAQAVQQQAKRESRERIAEAAREQAVAIANANITNAGERFNITNQIDADRQYTKDVLSFAQRRSDRLSKAQQLAAQTGANADAVKQYANGISIYAEQIRALGAERDNATDPYEIKRLDTLISGSMKSLNKLYEEMLSKVPKNTANEQLIQFLTQDAEPVPTRQIVPTYNPQTVNRRTVSRGRDPLGLFR